MQEQKEITISWNKLGKFTKVKFFADVAIAPTVRAGIQSLLTVSGLGGMRPNIILMGMHRERQSAPGMLGDQLVALRKELSTKKRKLFERPLDLRAYDSMAKVFPDPP